MTSVLPDLVGGELAAARTRLEAAGARVEVVETAPPEGSRAALGRGERWRVIAQRAADPGVVLVVAREIPLREVDVVV